MRFVLVLNNKKKMMLKVNLTENKLEIIDKIIEFLMKK